MEEAVVYNLIGFLLIGLFWGVIPITLGVFVAKKFQGKVEREAIALLQEKDKEYAELTKEISELSYVISKAMQGALSENYCYYPLICVISEYFNDNRAETIYDAVNIFVSEHGKPNVDLNMYMNADGSYNYLYEKVQNRYTRTSLNN